MRKLVFLHVSPKLGAIAAACCASALLLSGCTSASAEDEDREVRNSVDVGGVPNSLAKRLNSYAIHTIDGPEIDAHFFSISGASSLSGVMEKDMLTAFKDGGAFHKHRAFDPVLTDPDERWDVMNFIEGPGDDPTFDQLSGADSRAVATEEQDIGTQSASTSQPITVTNSVIAAGGNFVISRLMTSVGGKQKQKAYVTDVDQNVTSPAADLLSENVRGDVGTMTVNDKGMPAIDHDVVGESMLTDLGKRVRSALGRALELPPDSEAYLPDYTCELIPCTALTYDDGPADEKMTKELADHLKDADLRATFYQIGGNVHQHHKESKELLEMGNEVGGHSWSHSKLDTLAAPRIKQEMKKTDAALAKEGVAKTTQLRPPYGAASKTVDRTVDKRIVQWSVDTQDWQTLNTAKTIEAGSKAGPGSIILMHSIHETTVKAAPQLYKNLEAKGLYPVPAGYLFKGLPFETGGEYYCRGYGGPLCSNPEHPMAEKGKSMAKPALERD